jgi:uncharacterized protein (TIGR03437 family)
MVSPAIALEYNSAVPKLITFALLFAAAAEAQPTIQAVTNAISFQNSLSPGSLATIFGKNLIVGTGATTVTVGAKAALVLTGGIATVVSVQLPVDLPTGATTLTVTAGGQNSAPFNVTINAYSPALFPTVSGGTVGLFTDSVTGKAINPASPAAPAENVTGLAVGLGATNPPLATGAISTTSAPTVAKATLTVGGESSTVLYAGALPGTPSPSAIPGLYQVNFTVPRDASGCATNVVLTIGAFSSLPVTLPIATPLPALCAVQNAATGATRDAVHGAAPNSFIAVYAASLGGKDSTGTIFPSTDYQGIEVAFNGVPVPLYAVLPSVNLINTIVPSEAPTTGTGVITVKNSSGASQSYTVALAPADLGVFRLPDPNNPSRIQGVVLLQNTYWFAMPSSLAPSYNLGACTGLPAGSPCGQPAKPGDNIVIYLTGGGLATPNGDPNGKPVPTGSVAPVDGSVIYKTVLTPALTIGGIAAPVGFSGIAPGTASEYQINTTIPTGVQPGDDVPIVITMGSSTDTITIAIKAP